MFPCKYGRFSQDGCEYIINNPKTPRPWSNIISNGEYSILITQTGSGYSWGKNSFENRVTRFYHDFIKDDVGKYVYIRDEDTKEIWGATYKPMDKCGEDYEVIHGFGYSIFTHTYNGIKSSLKVFLSKEHKIEFLHITLENITKVKRNLSVFCYAELYLSNFPEENREFHNTFMEGKFYKEKNVFIGRKKFWGVLDKDGSYNNREYKYKFFMSSTKDIVSYECSRERFIGMYNSLKNPKSLRENSLSSFDDKNLDLISCVHIKISLPPYKIDKVCFYMGIEENEEDIFKILNTYREIKNIDEEFEIFTKDIREFVCCENIKTPNVKINFMILWCKYQTLMCRFLGKGSYYQINKGIGYRDHLQDSLIFLGSREDIIRKEILKQASRMFKDGSVIHFYLDESESFVKTNSSDDNLWLVYVSLIYINETGDFEILNEKVKYIDSFEENLYVHLKRTLMFSLKNVSENGLSKIMNHDWNDGISNFNGESVFVSEFLYLVLKEFREVSILKKDFEFLHVIDKYLEILKHGVNSIGFNGKWYLRGVSKEKYLGKYPEQIFLIPQVFSVISGICEKNRSYKVMKEVYINLNTKYGLKILNPPFKQIDKSVGYITRYAEGVRENGSIYYHSCMWGILSFILIGEIDISEEIIERILPINKGEEIDLYKLEPYVMPSSVEGDYSKNFGRGNWSFNTGSSSWFYRIITIYVIGVYGTLKGLLIDPKPFKSWRNFFIRKNFKGATFNIEFENQNGKNLEIYVNGQKIEGNIITNIKNGKVYNVLVKIN